MPIPANQIVVAEITLVASMVAAGGRVVPVHNVFHYARNSTVNPVGKTQLSTAFQAALVVPLALALNVRWEQSKNVIRWIDDAQDVPLDVAAAAVGAIATDSYDSRSAVFMLMKTNLRGRSYRGSKHFAPLSEADTTGDVLTGAGLARWQTAQAAVDAVLVDALGNTWVPCVFSRTLSQIIVNPTFVVYTQVQQTLLNKAVGQMKRRNAGSAY